MEKIMKKLSLGLMYLSCISFLLFGILSCGNNYKSIKDESYVLNDSKISLKAQKMATTSSAEAVTFMDSANGMEMEEALMEAPVASPDVQPVDFERKFIKNGSVTVEVNDFKFVEDNVNELVKMFNGYITNQYNYETNQNYTIRIPSDKFEAVMGMTRKIGVVKYSSSNSTDVTDSFYDLESRINSKKIMKEKMESYLSKAENISDLLKIEKQLNEVISELESMEGRMKRLSNDISYSTIYLNVNLPTGYSREGFRWPDLGEDFRNFISNVVKFFAGILMFFVYLIAIGIPVLAIIALLYWLLFGKIGILVKLFKKLSKK